MCAALAVCGAAGTAHARLAYRQFTLKNALGGDKHVVLSVVVDNGRVSEPVAMIAGRPRTAQDVANAVLRVEEGRLRGLFALGLDFRSGRGTVRSMIP